MPNRAIEAGTGITTATVIGGFTIYGGGGTHSSVIFNGGSSPTIRNNTIYGGSGNVSSVGIMNLNFSSPLIINNIIDGGGVGETVTGIDSRFSSSPTIVNNTIKGGSGVTSIGIISDSSSMPTIENNIVFTSGSTNGICYWEESASGTPASMWNNDLFNCPTALYNEVWSGGSGNLTSISAMESDLTAEGIPTGGNVSVDPGFVDQAGGDWYFMTDGTAPCSITQGGLDLTGTVDDDKDGIVRTVPYSMGAYEWDGACAAP